MSIKKVAKKVLPSRLVLAIQKYRYVKAQDKISVDSDPDFRGIEKIVSQGDTVLDIGANMGFFTIFLSRHVGPSGLVISVEPVPSTYAMLRHMIKKLRLDNVRSINIAVSDHPGKVTMEVPVNAEGEEDYYLAKIVPDGGATSNRKIIAEVDTIDGLVNRDSLSVSFLKIDVEGHELTCLRGAAGLLGRQKPAIIIEVWGDPDDSQQPGIQTFNFLKSQGYSPYLWKNGKFHPRKHGEVSVNYFFLTPGHAVKHAAHVVS